MEHSSNREFSIGKVLAKYDDPLVFRLDPELAYKIKHYLALGFKRLAEGADAEGSAHSSEPNQTLNSLKRYLTKSGRLENLDHDTLWVGIAADLDLCLNDYGRPFLEVLVRRDITNIKWMVAAARWVLMLSGYDPSQTLRDSLTRLTDSTSELRADLKNLVERREDDPKLQEAAGDALGVMEGGKLS